MTSAVSNEIIDRGRELSRHNTLQTAQNALDEGHLPI